MKGILTFERLAAGNGDKHIQPSPIAQLVWLASGFGILKLGNSQVGQGLGTKKRFGEYLPQVASIDAGSQWIQRDGTGFSFTLLSER
jgi:hypothetical protein